MNTKVEIKELRFYIGELTEAYVLVNAWDDVPIGVQGWHFKAFPPSKSVIDILTEDIGKGDYLLWPQQAPPRSM